MLAKQELWLYYKLKNSLRVHIPCTSKDVFLTALKQNIFNQNFKLFFQSRLILDHMHKFEFIHIRYKKWGSLCSFKRKRTFISLSSHCKNDEVKIFPTSVSSIKNNLVNEYLSQNKFKSGDWKYKENLTYFFQQWLRKYKIKKPGQVQNFTDLISLLQFRAGLEQTGELDEETKKLFVIPRCGNPNEEDEKQIPGSAKRRKKRYYLQGTRWRKKVSDLYRLVNKFWHTTAGQHAKDV